MRLTFCAAIEKRKPFCLVHEMDKTNGGAPLEQIMSECPAELHGPVFGTGVRPQEVVTWHRTKEFQLVSLLRISAALLSSSHVVMHQQVRTQLSETSKLKKPRATVASAAASPLAEESSSYRRWFGRPRPLSRSTTPAPIGSLSIFHPGAITERPLSLAASPLEGGTEPRRPSMLSGGNRASSTTIITSSANEGADELAARLKNRVEAAIITHGAENASTSHTTLAAVAAARIRAKAFESESELSSLLKLSKLRDESLCMLLLLNEASFAPNCADGDALADHVR
jgi:hypothetical protein